MRIDHWTLTGTTALSPWLQSRVPIGAGLSLRAAGGLYRQAPATAEVAGVRGTPTLAVARSVHADLGVEGFIRGAVRWQVTAYNREDRDWLRLQGTEPRVSGLLFVPVSTTTHWLNALDGHARGVEWLVERRASRGISGWLSYALGFNRYTDSVSGERFWGDFDQRHTLNAFATYRLSDRTSASARFRIGSNTPVFFMVGLGCTPAFVFATVDGMRSADPATLELMASVDAGRWEVLRRVRLPSAAPSLFTAARFNFGFALAISFYVEGANLTNEGIGAIGRRAASQANSSDALWASVFAMAIIGFLGLVLLSGLERTVLHWHASQRSQPG